MAGEWSMAELNATAADRSDMVSFAYPSGEVINSGDRIRYHGEDGYVDFVVTQDVVQPDLAWYLEQFSSGGIMIVANGFGSVFLALEDLDDDLQFVSRATGKG
jgi:hypothetical protein